MQIYINLFLKFLKVLYNYVMDKNNIYDCVIIGGGPAGVTAGIYLARAGKKVALLEGGMFGGQVATTAWVENYPAVGKVEGFTLATKFLDDLKLQDVEIIYENAISCELNNKIKTIITLNRKIKTLSVIIAMGVRPKQISPEIEARFVGKGISYCATCDGHFYKGKSVAVIGGGKSAFVEAEYLVNLAKEVYLIHRSNNYRVSEVEINKLKNKGVKFLPYQVLTNVNGNSNLNEIELSNTQTGEITKLKVDGLFVAVGRVPNSEIFNGKLKLDEFGFIESENCETSIKGVFVAGDIRTKNLRQIVTATSDGAVCATLALAYLKEV